MIFFLLLSLFFFFFLSASTKIINQKLNKRKNINLKLINKLRKNQLPIRLKKKRSTYVIKNNFVRNTAKKNVKMILKKISQKLKKRKNVNPKLINILRRNQLPARLKKKKSTYVIKNNFVRNTAKRNVQLIMKKISK